MFVFSRDLLTADFSYGKQNHALFMYWVTNT